MLLTTTQQIPARPAETRIVAAGIRCELCSKDSSPGYDNEYRHNDWDGCTYNVNDVTVRHRQGYSYPEGGDATSTILDIGPTCFQTKLIPWFESQGGKIRKEECDW